ncbi:hypothetical protein KUCAC02_013339 [Chaenocephalus aceratus]|nr:hypothetical protein KUCAC02_013339 [Chaenocephalus aceratus]
MVNTCTMCLKDYTALNQHLIVTHKVLNKEERVLLVKLAGGKIDVRSQKCPVPACVATTFSRLDRHMKTHFELSAASKDKLLKVVRKRLMLDKLAALRATNPTVPMVSRLDVDRASEGFPDYVAAFNVLLEDFRKLQEGPDPSPKLLNNVQSKLHRIKQFIGWMSHGKTRLGRLECLCDVDRVRKWVKYQRASKMALTTTLHYLKNVRQFLVYIQEIPPAASHIKKGDLKRVIRELTASIRSWSRPVVIHQLKVKEKKDETMHSIKDLRKCRRLALVAIPKVIAKLEEEHTTLDRNKLSGYVLAYLASFYGHRLGVFLNLTDEQVSKAVHGVEENDYLIKVENHKTNESYGTAKMLLTDREYGWLLFIMRIKQELAKGGEVSRFVFFNTTFFQDKNLTKYLKSAWSEMQLRGQATFTSLRGAVATFARNRHGEYSQDRKKMAQLMCHSTKTADKYYTMDMTMEQARRGRQLFEQAQEERPMKRRQQESTPPQSEMTCRVLLSPLKRSRVLLSTSKINKSYRIKERSRRATRRR